MTGKSKYVSIMLFRGVSDAVDELMGDIGYWPNRAEFLREAVLEKIRIERQSLNEASWINQSEEEIKKEEAEKEEPEEE